MKCGAPALALAALALSACGGSEEGRRASASGSGIGVDAGGTAGGGEDNDNGDDDPDQGGDQGADQGGDNGVDDTSDDTKFDLGVQPDLPGDGCDDGGNGGYEFSYIWIANSNEGTVSKINTETGIEEGRYYTAPAQGSGNPSRTSVNLLGDVAVSNRDPPASTTKIAAEPERCVDKNGNGTIETSTGATPLNYADDECILWNLPIPSSDHQSGPRPTAWEGAKNATDPCVYDEPRLWIGYKDNAQNGVFLRVDGTTGAIQDTVMGPAWGSGYGPYGGAVNAEGDLWVTGLGSSHAIHIDSVTLGVTNVGPPPGGAFYGMAVDKTGDLWGSGSNTVNHYDVATSSWITLTLTNGSARGIQIDQDGIAWVALNGQCGVASIDTATDTITNQLIPLPGCGVPVGISIDRDQYVWIVDQAANLAYKMDPDTLTIALTFTALNGPYTYSDMTGSGLNLVVNPPG